MLKKKNMRMRKKVIEDGKENQIKLPEMKNSILSEKIYIIWH